MAQTNMWDLYTIPTNSKSFETSTYGKQCAIKGHIDGNKSNVIHELKCKFYPKDYIRKTITPPRIRMNNHRLDTVSKSRKTLIISRYSPQQEPN